MCDIAMGISCQMFATKSANFWPNCSTVYICYCTNTGYLVVPLFLVIHVHVYITLVFKDLIMFVSKIKISIVDRSKCKAKR